MDEEKINEVDLVNLIPLDKETSQLAQQIIDEKDVKKTQDLVKIFNLNQAKKNVLRVLKLNSLLDKVSDQMIERFERKPGEFSNSDLLNYLQVTQNAIDRANKSLNLVDETPTISLTQVNVNIEETLDRDSRAKITEAINKILEKSKEMEIINNEDIVEVEAEESKEEPENTVNNNITNILNEEE